MIIGINGFSSIADATITNLSDINVAVGNIRKFQAMRPGTSVYIGSFTYSSTTPQCQFTGTGMSLQSLGTNSYAAYNIPSLSTMISQVGDTLTVGCRLLLTSAHAATNPIVVGFTSTGVNAVPTLATPTGDTLVTNAYVEVQVSMLAADSYSYRVWVNGVSRLNTTRTDLLSNVFIGTGLNWRASSNPAGVIQFRDMYWAYNREGKEERLGPCTVSQLPRDVVSGVGNPGAATAGDITKQRATWDLGTASVAPPYTPVTLVSPVVQKGSFPAPNPNMRIKAFKMPTVGKPTIAGTTGVVTSQILDETGKVVSSNSVDNVGSDYFNGVSVALVDTTGKSIDDLKNYLFVSSGEKADIV